MELRISKSKIGDVVQRLPRLLKAYRAPVARIQTETEGWIIELEHLELGGLDKVAVFASKGEPEGEWLRYFVEKATGRADGKQFYLRAPRNGTYAERTNVRDASELNVF